MLFPNNKEPETGSLIPSMSTAGENRKARINTDIAVKRQGNIKTPNQPMYNRWSVDVTQLMALDHDLEAAEYLLFA